MYQEVVMWSSSYNHGFKLGVSFPVIDEVAPPLGTRKNRAIDTPAFLDIHAAASV
jgi:hypothetical protein